MYDGNQLVEMVWCNTTRNFYEAKGYRFTKTHDKFYVKAKELSLNSHAEVEVTCDYCGAKFKKKFSFVTRGRKDIPKDACSNCKQQKQQDVSRAKRMNASYGLAKSICDEKGYIFIEPDCEYKNQHMYIEFICPKHGKQKISLFNFLNKKICAKCAIEQKKTNKLDISYVISKIENDGNELLNPSDYKRTTIHNLRIKCKCGNEYITSFDCYIHMGVNRCPICTKRISKNELGVADVLDKYNVAYEREKRFIDCRDKLPLPFDFYLPKYNLLIEFDGEQHYKPIRNNVLKFQSTQHHDKIKSDYCNAHNVDLLRIPYWEKKNIETIIRDKLKI